MLYRQLLYATSLLATIASATAQVRAPVLSASQLAFRAFPAADTVRQITRDVDLPARRRIEGHLPFRVHFEELGEHRLHVAFRGQRPLGLLYARSEKTEWGLAEIGWAMSLEGKVLGFEFASSRSSKASALASSAFATSLVGRTFDELVTLHNRRAAQPTPGGESKRRPVDDLPRTVLRSALKATVVTAVVWKDEVAKLADLAMLFEEFPGATHGIRQVAVLPPRPDSPRKILSLRFMQARGRGGFDLGSIARTLVRYGKTKVELRWVFDASGNLIRVHAATSWADDDQRRACSALRGYRLDQADLPKTPLTTAARELAQELTRLRSKKKAR